MSHYEKLALIIIRAMGCGLALYGLLPFASLLVAAELTTGSYREFFGLYLVVYGGYLLGGIVLFALGKPLAALIARRF